jgi:hypothetical protein
MKLRDSGLVCGTNVLMPIIKRLIIEIHTYIIYRTNDWKNIWTITDLRSDGYTYFKIGKSISSRSGRNHLSFSFLRREIELASQMIIAMRVLSSFRRKF